jgi:hypothetical protein
MTPAGRTLKMVTQKRGVFERDATETAVDDMMERIGDKFTHVWASVRGPKRLIPDSYHIKVASRDGEEVWLSSFKQAELFPLEDGEAAPFPDVELFVPEEAVAVSTEKVPGVTYEDELVLTNEELEIQPLLTPDRDADDDRMFLKFATEMISKANERIFIQNQSFNLTAENNEQEQAGLDCRRPGDLQGRGGFRAAGGY